MEDSCGDLHCYRAPGVAISCWQFPSWRERLKFLLTGKVWLYCLQDWHPPVSLSVHKPELPKGDGSP
jgi:hypothetical protein